MEKLDKIDDLLDWLDEKPAEETVVETVVEPVVETVVEPVVVEESETIKRMKAIDWNDLSQNDYRYSLRKNLPSVNIQFRHAGNNDLLIWLWDLLGVFCWDNIDKWVREHNIEEELAKVLKPGDCRFEHITFNANKDEFTLYGDVLEPSDKNIIIEDYYEFISIFLEDDRIGKWIDLDGDSVPVEEVIALSTDNRQMIGLIKEDLEGNFFCQSAGGEKLLSVYKWSPKLSLPTRFD